MTWQRTKDWLTAIGQVHLLVLKAPVSLWISQSDRLVWVR